MEIIEQCIIGKRGDRYCEDGLVTTTDFIAVIDGSTSKATRHYSFFRSNGRQAMMTVAKAVRKADGRISMRDFCREATRRMARHYRKSEMDFLALHPEERLCASAVVYSRLSREVWMIGDCQCMIDGTPFENPKPYEEPMAERRAEAARQLLAQGRTVEQLRRHDEARDAIIAELKERMHGQNVEYSVIDGFHIPLQHVRQLTLDFQPHEIVMASDGYPVLKPTLAASEEALSTILAEDPLCISRYRATKGLMKESASFDDRTYIRFRV